MSDETKFPDYLQNAVNRFEDSDSDNRAEMGRVASDYAETAYNTDLGLLGTVSEGIDAAKHPLDVAPKTMPYLGWIDDYAGFASMRSASPLAFNRLAALVLAATSIQRSAVLKMSFGDIRPNLFGVYIGASSVWHKTTSLNLTGNLLQKVQMENLLLPAEFTPEGLFRYLSVQPFGLIKRDEIGRLFGSDSVRYLQELKPLLTELYDGNSIKKQKADETITVRNPYICILGATTPSRFYSGISGMDWTDGFLPRWLYALPEGEPDFNSVPLLLSASDENRWASLASTLARLDMHSREQQPTPFHCEDGAIHHWFEWTQSHTKSAYEFGDDTAMAITSRYSTIALKFSMILASVNDSWGYISEATISSACDLADFYKSVALRVLRERNEHSVTAETLQRVYKRIYHCAARDVTCTMRSILRDANMKKSLAQPAVDQLIEMGAVVKNTMGKTEHLVPTNRRMATLPIKGIGR